jgi:hypothetical protein
VGIKEAINGESAISVDGNDHAQDGCLSCDEILRWAIRLLRLVLCLSPLRRGLEQEERWLQLWNITMAVTETVDFLQYKANNDTFGFCARFLIRLAKKGKSLWDTISHRRV